MRVLISALSRFTQPTGICRHAVNLARGLGDLPEVSKVFLIVGQWQEEYFRNAFGINLSKIEIVPIAIANNSLSRNLWFAFGLPKVAKIYHPEIVHLGFPVPVFRSRFNCPVVATVHDLYPYDLPESYGWFNGFSKRLFMKRCMHACDGVTCVSECTRQNLGGRFPELSSRVPVTLVHNYADFSPAVETPFFADGRPPFLLTVAQHQPNKRLDLMLRAFARLRSESRIKKELQLFVVGSEGAHSEQLRALAEELHLKESVRWLPGISDQQLKWTYQNCSAFIASSCIEGFCLPLLEALVFNCRIVASDIPIFHEIAGDTPFYFDLAHTPVENLMAALLRALNSPARESAKPPRFSRKATASECLTLYSILLPGLTARAVPGKVHAPDAQGRELHAAAE